MKIELDTKELAALIDMIREQRDPVCDARTFANEITKNLPQKLTSKLNLRT